MKIVCISDSHCQLNKISVPDGDILIHAGDLTSSGSIQETSQELFRLSKHRNRFKHIVLVEGNHDFLGQKNPSIMDQMCKDNGVTLLRDSGATIEGLQIYGSPWQPEFHNWAFNLPRGQALKDKWALIPENTQILISHGPPLGILDLVPSPVGFHAGCEDLYNRVMGLKDLRFHIFGHLHMNHGSVKIGNTTFCNASTCTEQYKPTNNPLTFEI